MWDPTKARFQSEVTTSSNCAIKASMEMRGMLTDGIGHRNDAFYHTFAFYDTFSKTDRNDAFTILLHVLGAW